MNRREFIVGLIASFTAPIIARVTSAQAPTITSTKIVANESAKFFNSTLEYGNGISVVGRPEKALIEKTKKLLLDDAIKFLPKGTRFVILDGGTSDFGYCHKFAWYYHPLGNKSPIGKLDEKRGATVLCEATV